MTKVVDATGLNTYYNYFADGTLGSVLRDAGRGTVGNYFGYDVLGRKTSQQDPDSGLSTFQYNALGEVIVQIDAKGQRTENEYDARGRVWRRTVKAAGGAIETQSTFTFDTATNGAGQLASESITGTYAAWSGQSSLALGHSRSATYDAMGRGLNTTTTIDGVAYGTLAHYDELGRAYRGQDASGRWVKTEYNARGFVRAVCNSIETDTAPTCPADANTYVATLATDEWGHVAKERRGNSAALEVNRTYYAQNGKVAEICGGTSAGCNLVKEGYGWDLAGNLSTHSKETRYVETFTYDSLNRVRTTYLAQQDGVPVNQLMQNYEYDQLGNICHRDTYGWASRDYTYAGRAGCGLGGANSTQGAGGTGTLGPGQVTALVDGTTLNQYYDANGNMIQRDGPVAGNDWVLKYNAANQAHEITKDTGERMRFWYGADGARYKSEDGAKKTLYLGNVEIVTDGAVVTTRRTIAGVMLQTVVGTTATNYYLFHDQLGSLVRIANAAGAVVSSMDFLAFGGRRNTDTQAANGTPPSLTPRGFTGHEMLDSVGLIHMNGRIYDQYLSRFLQPDPVIQAPENAQSWNAYTYCINNPQKYVDPTGNFWVALLGAVQNLGTVYAVGAGITATQIAVAGIAIAGAGYIATAQAGASGVQGVSGAYGAQNVTNFEPVHVSAPGEISPLMADKVAGDLVTLVGSVRFYATGIEFDYFNTSGELIRYQQIYTPNGPAFNTYHIGFTAAPETSGLQTFQSGLDVAGFIPGVGAGPDLINAGVYAYQGQWGWAAASVGFAVPLLGDAAAAVVKSAKGLKAAKKARGLSSHGGSFSSTTNAAGGEVWTSVGKISQNDFATYVNSGLYKGEVNIISGVHGMPSGATTPALDLFNADVARFGKVPGVRVYNYTEMTPGQLTNLLRSPGTTIGGFCDSAACLTHFK